MVSRQQKRRLDPVHRWCGTEGAIAAARELTKLYEIATRDEQAEREQREPNVEARAKRERRQGRRGQRLDQE